MIWVSPKIFKPLGIETDGCLRTLESAGSPHVELGSGPAPGFGSMPGQVGSRKCAMAELILELISGLNQKPSPQNNQTLLPEHRRGA